jgi:hypothetical protein
MGLQKVPFTMQIDDSRQVGDAAAFPVAIGTGPDSYRGQLYGTVI